MVISILKILPLPGNRDAVLDILRSVIDLIMGQPGCLGCACYEEHDGSRAVLYVEQWASKEALHRHIRSNLYRRVISVMELADKAPEIRFFEVAQPMGMELIETLRANALVPGAQ
jgi:quinol monooxygenase YgiN